MRLKYFYIYGIRRCSEKNKKFPIEILFCKDDNDANLRMTPFDAIRILREKQGVFFIFHEGASRQFFISEKMGKIEVAVSGSEIGFQVFSQLPEMPI